MKISDDGEIIDPDIFGDTDPKKMPPGMLFGAVEVDYPNAVRANIQNQHQATCPRHWYVPAVFMCADCKEMFPFPIEEQKFWYEELKFYPGVTPTRCAPCRKKERKRKADEQIPKEKRA